MGVFRKLAEGGILGCFCAALKRNHPSHGDVCWGDSDGFELRIWARGLFWIPKASDVVATQHITVMIQHCTYIISVRMKAKRQI